MKRKFLNLSLVIALFIVGVFAINKTIYATNNTYSINNVPGNNSGCCNGSTTVTKYVKASTKRNGTKEEKCNICGKPCRTGIWYKASTVDLSSTSFTYNGLVQTPYITVKDSNGAIISQENYKVTYEKDGKKVKKPMDIGTYKVKITFKNAYTGVIEKSFKITKKAPKKSDIVIENVTYTGKKTEPKNIYCNGVKLKKNVDYKISKISNNKKYGTASVTIKFIGNYKGTVKTTYKISTKPVSGVKLKKRDTSSITISWKKVKDATGYKIYRYNYSNGDWEYYKTTSSTSAKITAVPDLYNQVGNVDIYIVAYKKIGNKTYKSTPTYYWDSVKPGTVKYTVSSTSKGKIKVKYKNLKGYTDVQIQVSESETFNKKEAKVQNFYNWVGNDLNNNYYKVPKLTSKKTYYVRSRAFLSDMNDKKVYGNWGTVKKITVK